VFFGGNTSCVEVRPSDSTVLIFDCGTGMRELGMELLRSRRELERIYLLIGHTHWDHIQGFPFFSPAFLPDVELNICAPAGFQHSLEEAIAGQMQYSYFPVKLQELSSRIYYHELGEGFLRIGEVLVETRYLNHTAPTIAYRVTDGITTVAYVTDHEPFWSVPGPVFLHPGDRQHVEFLRNADLIIHDAQYTSEQYETKRGWGHSTIEYATDVAVSARAARLALFHHDPAHDDATLRDLENEARQRAASFGSDVEVFCAAEGQELEIVGRGKASFTEGASALEGEPDEDWRVLVLTRDPADVGIVRMSLTDDDCIITSTSDVRSACDIVAQSCPDVVIMSAAVGGEVAVHIEALRNASGNAELPVVLLTEQDEDHERMVITQGLATDYIAKPFSPAMLRCRVRAWKSRVSGTAAASSAAFARTKEKQPAEAISTNNFLASSSIFRSLQPAELLQLTGSGIEEIYPAGKEIIRQGDRSDGIYVVLSGRIRVVESVGENEIDLVLGEFGAGEIFGELGALRNQPRSATVIAADDTRCLKLPQAEFLTALKNSTELCSALQQIIAGRLEHTELLVARYAPDTVTALPSRLAFGELYRRFASSARRRKSSLLLLVVDIVQLKRINDQYGYQRGDEVLRGIADTLVEIGGDHGLVSRYGGDEFAVLLQDRDSQRGELTTRIRAQLQQMAIHRALPLSIEYSIGYAFSETPPETADELLRQAGEDMQVRRRSISR
jgi:diguanylate cyclase (GGDEF)-like protein